MNYHVWIQCVTHEAQLSLHDLINTHALQIIICRNLKRSPLAIVNSPFYQPTSTFTYDETDGAALTLKPFM